MNLKKLSTQNFLILFTAISISVISITALWMYDIYIEANKNFDIIKKNYINSQKNILKNNIDNITHEIEDIIDVCKQTKSNINKKKLQHIILNKLRKYRFGKDGYIFILNTKGIVLMHPIKPELEGKNIINLKGRKGNFLVKEAIKDAKSKYHYFITYYWLQPSSGKVAKKIGYAGYIPQWDWVIGSGVYLNDINHLLNKEYKKLQKRVEKRILQVILIFVLIILIMFCLLCIRIKKTKYAFLIFHDFLKHAHNTSNLIDINKLEYQEFKELAKDINHMVLKRIEMQKEIEEKNKQLLEQTRLAQMGEILNMIAHQWRQPLMAISTTALIINLKAENNELDSKSAVELTDKIIKYSKDLSDTIDNFRNFFKQNKQKSKTNWSVIVTSVLNIIKPSLDNENIKLIKELNCDDEFLSYGSEIKQALLNLIKNAKEALLNNDIKNPYIKIKSFRENNKCILEISDNAGGIPDEIMDKIFDPYFSTKTQKNGTGLGLYMTKIIIEEHCKGKLSVRNDKFGAVFRIEIKGEK